MTDAPDAVPLASFTIDQPLEAGDVVHVEIEGVDFAPARSMAGDPITGTFAERAETFAAEAACAVTYCADPDLLVIARTNLRRATAALRTLADAIDAALIAQLGVGARHTVVGVDTVEVRGEAWHRQWESQPLLREVLRRAVDPEGTGEIPPGAGEWLDQVFTALTTVLNFGPNLSWRSGDPVKGNPGLKTLGIRPADWSESTYAGPPRVESKGL